MVMGRGRIVEHGTFQELSDIPGGVFAELMAGHGPQPGASEARKAPAGRKPEAASGCIVRGACFRVCVFWPPTEASNSLAESPFPFSVPRCRCAGRHDAQPVLRCRSRTEEVPVGADAEKDRFREEHERHEDADGGEARGGVDQVQGAAQRATVCLQEMYMMPVDDFRALCQPAPPARFQCAFLPLVYSPICASPRQVFDNYAKAFPGGWVTVCALLCFNFLKQAAAVGIMLWLAAWSGNTIKGYSDFGYLTVYAFFSILAAVVTYVKSLLWTFFGLKAAGTLHEALFQAVLNTRMTFFDVTPLGRILQRFSKDTDTLDNNLPAAWNMTTEFITGLLSQLATMCSIKPFLIPFLMPIGYLYFKFQAFFRASYREIKRLDSTTSSPVYAHFSETLAGLVTIRAFGHQERFIADNASRVATNQKAFYTQRCACDRWLPIRLETVGNSIVLVVAMLAVAAEGTGMAAMSGLVLSFSLDITGLLSWVIRQWSETESAMARPCLRPTTHASARARHAPAICPTSGSSALTRATAAPHLVVSLPQVSVERVSEYAALPPEEDTGAIVHGGGAETAFGWPSSGALRVDNLSLRYQPAMPLVLNVVTFDVRSGEKVGLVGRTGSGKSTMLTALWRIVEPEHGSIWCAAVCGGGRGGT